MVTQLCHRYLTCIISSVLFFVASASDMGYDIGCVYPKRAPEPFAAEAMISQIGSDMLREIEGETPMFVRGATYFGLCQGACSHYHDPRVADPFTPEDKSRPFGALVFMQNAFSQVMCTAVCDYMVVEEIEEALAEDFRGRVNDRLKLGIPRHGPEERQKYEEAVADYYKRGENQTLKQLVEEDGYHPFNVGLVAGLRLRLAMDDDGWNARGTLRYARETGQVEPCTGSCRRFQNLINYSPKPDPRKNPDLSTDMDKYNCTGLCRHWQPLQEGTIAGSLSRQEFVTPHIGQTGRTFLRDVTATLEDPKYDLYAESLEVIKQLKMTASDGDKKKAVRFHDSKGHVRNAIRKGMSKQFSHIDFQEYAIYTVGIAIVEYDAVIQAWHEKVIHDYVRPTTYIKHWDSDILETYGGDIDHDGPVEIKARDFEALIRVMPHAEFPSGSSCLCTAYAEFVDEYTQFFEGRKLKDWSFKLTLPGKTKADTWFFHNMTHLRDECAESRLWGGMHFRAAIPAGTEICGGLGKLAREWVDKMKDESIEYEGEIYYRNSTRPTCKKNLSPFKRNR